jgi:hypothetical protein
MRVYVRLPIGTGGTVWTTVTTAASGDNSAVYVVALLQVLALNLNESPFYATFGIPAQQSVLQQVPPDYYVALTQQIYAQFFASLVITRTNNPTPTYNVAVITNYGAVLTALVNPQGYLVTSGGSAIITSGGQEISI